MIPALHIFIYVVKRKDDPFKGIIKALEGSNNVRISEIQLTEREYDTINLVEYSIRKYARIFYYKKIYRKIENEIYSRIEKQDNSEKIFIYLADEGVWAEILKIVKAKCIKMGRPVSTVNVQHGFFVLGRWFSEEKFGVLLRKAVNLVSGLLFGYPNFGLAFGRGQLDSYLVYGKEEKKFLQKEGVRDVYNCPRLIKEGFLERYRNNAGLYRVDKKFVLFVMPHFVPGTGMKCTFEELLEFLYPYFEMLNQKYSYTVLIRFHPGMTKEAWRKVYDSSKTSSVSKVDCSADISESMAISDFIMGLHSTALFEAGLIGKVPISFNTPFVDADLEFEHEPIYFSESVDTALDRLINQRTINKYKLGFHKDPDGESFLADIIGGKSII